MPLYQHEQPVSAISCMMASGNAHITKLYDKVQIGANVHVVP